MTSTAKSKSDRPTVTSKRPLDLLVLDDDSFDRANICRLTSRTGLDARIHEVSCLSELSDAVSATSFDLALIDRRLPVGSGLDAAEIVHSSPMNFDTPAIMITNDACVGEAVEALHAGFVNYLPKERLSERSILEVINEALLEGASSRTTNSELDVTRDLLKGISNGCVETLLPKVKRVRYNLIAMQHAPETGRRERGLALQDSVDNCTELMDGLRELDEYLKCWTAIKH